MAGGTAQQIETLLAEARAHVEVGNRMAAFALIHRTEGLAPSPAGWRAIGDAWHAAGNAASGEAAHLRAMRASARDPELAAAAADAGPLLAARLAAHPTDIAAIRLLAARQEDLGQAAELLRRALALAPGYAEARYDLATALARAGRRDEAVAEVERLLADDPGNAAWRDLGAALRQAGGDG